MATKCWLIWKERRLIIFQSKSTTSVQLALAVQRHLAFWSPLSEIKKKETNTTGNTDQQVNSASNSLRQASHIDKGWTKPPLNQFKLNFDASWIDALRSAGYGLIIRYDTGSASQARAGTFQPSTAEEAEALSLLEAAKSANSMNLKDFWVEGDYQRLILYVLGKTSNIFLEKQ
ncbi:uncharacterized protein LOC113271399 [Papaver somniferum]|uniref:uncharacterized protein LOC113271399 n=1 Tax=Papaver somniferum TaxID=3469 RepID=UPI000E6F9593|nr:uncharacterized protein LOC113271399 [Papaver somniferum]